MPAIRRSPARSRNAATIRADASANDQVATSQSTTPCGSPPWAAVARNVK